MSIAFDKINKTILIKEPTIEVTIQELVNAIRDWQDELTEFDEADFIKAAGKQDLGGGILVGITLELRKNWRIQFEDRPGPDITSCKVFGGNLVAVNDYNNNPIKPSAYTQVTIAQSSAAITVETGTSGLTDEESKQLSQTLTVKKFLGLK